jgi:hypothetical protein
MKSAEQCATILNQIIKLFEQIDECCHLNIFLAIFLFKKSCGIQSKQKVMYKLSVSEYFSTDKLTRKIIIMAALNEQS